MADVSCAPCGAVLGWRYVAAEAPAQRYKVGSYILESRRVVVGCSWEGDESDGDGDVDGVRAAVAVAAAAAAAGARPGGGSAEGWGLAEVGEEEELQDEEALLDAVEEDESELEDLFAGVWSAESARWRRARRLSGR